MFGTLGRAIGSWGGVGGWVDGREGWKWEGGRRWRFLSLDDDSPGCTCTLHREIKKEDLAREQQREQMAREEERQHQEAAAREAERQRVERQLAEEQRLAKERAEAERQRQLKIEERGVSERVCRGRDEFGTMFSQKGLG